MAGDRPPPRPPSSLVPLFVGIVGAVAIIGVVVGISVSGAFDPAAAGSTRGGQAPRPRDRVTHSAEPAATAGSAAAAPTARPAATSLPPPTTRPAAIAAAPPATEPRAPAPTTTVTVVPGQSLWSIAHRVLGARASDASIQRTWQQIYHLNRTVIGADADLIRPGQVLRIRPPP